LSCFLGCASGKTHDIGDENVGSVNLGLADYVADWDGYAEGWVFNDSQAEPNTDRIRLSIEQDGTGYLRVGHVDLNPLPTNGSEPLLDGVWREELLGGISYPISDVRVEDRRLRFQLSAMYPWVSWCAAQTPVATSDPQQPYNCLSYTSNEWDLMTNTTLTDGSAGGAAGHVGTVSTCTVRSKADENIIEPVGCGAGRLCMGYCLCTETSCAISFPNSPPVTFDASLNEAGTELEGTLVIGLFPIDHITIRMTK
jgi:hypothetical protein